MVPQRIVLLSLLLITVAAAPLLAQPGYPKGMTVAIQGEVRYAQGGAPVENALVRLEATAGGLIAQVQTDRTGKFSFPGISLALYRVTAIMAGYRPAAQDVNLTTTPDAHLILTLVADTSAPETRVVPNEDTTVDAKVPKEARDEYEKGRATLLGGTEPAKGIPHLESAVKIYPDFLQAQLLLGTAYLDAHQPDKAEAALKHALAIDPKTSQALFALGEVYRMTKKYAEAEGALVQGLKMNDSSWQGHLTLGRLYLDTGDLEKAGPEVGRALQLNPKNAETYLVAGNLLLKAGRAEEAQQMFQQYLQLDPKGPYSGQTKKVIENIKKAIAEKKK